MFQVLEDVQTPELKPMESVGKFVAENKDLLNNFFKYAKSLKNAVGLASNQVGLEDRFIALKTTSGWTLAINPTIVTASG
jgi:peptide deformylase